MTSPTMSRRGRVKVPEGIVLASDSASTVQGGVGAAGPNTPTGVLKVFLNATKVLQIGKLPVGVMTWGVGSFGARTIASLVEEFANTEKVRDLSSDSLDIRDLSGQLYTFMSGKSDNFFPAIPKEARPRSGVVVCGYSGSEFFPEEYVMVVPTEQAVHVRPPKNGQQDFGANWWGATDAIVRFHFGRDDRLFQILKDRGMEAAQVEELSKKLRDDLQYPDVVPGDAARRRHRLR